MVWQWITGNAPPLYFDSNTTSKSLPVQYRYGPLPKAYGPLPKAYGPVLAGLNHPVQYE